MPEAPKQGSFRLEMAMGFEAGLEAVGPARNSLIGFTNLNLGKDSGRRFNWVARRVPARR
jgi:hypothetical protein